MVYFNQKKIEECAAWVRENGLMEYGGARLKDFCAYFGIDNKTYYGWMKNSDFSDSIKKAKNEFKESRECIIVKSLFEAAKGREYEETKTEYKDVNGQPKIKSRTITKKRVEPNIGAAIFLLTNIAPERWQNKHKQELSGDLPGLTIVVDNGDDKKMIEQIKDL